MEIQPRIVTPHEIVISSQSLLALTGATGMLLKSRRWGLAEYTTRANNLGAKLMYEPLKLGWSPARNEFDAVAPASSVLRDIAYLAEPARNEIRLSDYFTKRIHFQLLYALLEEKRFSIDMINAMLRAEHKLALAHATESFPLRVYSDRIQDGVANALIFEPDMGMKIYAQNLGELVESTKTPDELVQQSQQDCARYNVIGIELNLLQLTSIFRDNPEKLSQVITNLLSANNPKHPDLALVQAILIQPARRDLPSGNISYDQMNRTIDITAQQGFRGTIIFSPGGGDPEAEIKNLKDRFLI